MNASSSLDSPLDLPESSCVTRGAPRSSATPLGSIESLQKFSRRYRLRAFIVSVIVLIPCWWHRRIVASDLGSHLYNAWLVQLIRGNHVPGLYLAHQHTNVLFDLLLDALGRVVSLHTAEPIAVSLCVLIFFWGMFALAAAAAGRAPWCVFPVMAMFSYGYTFHMGFFNYYLALGLSFWGIALVRRARPRELWLFVPVAALTALAHPLGLAWLVAGSIYVFVATRIPLRWHVALLAVAIAALAAAHFYFWHYNVVEEQMLPFFHFNGADQFILFGPRYRYVEYAFLLFAIMALARDLWPSRSAADASATALIAPRSAYAIPAELYLILFAAVLLLPEGIRFAEKVPALALLTGRLTSVTGAVICCLLAAMRPRRWHALAYLAIAALFFVFVYGDTAAANRMELQTENLVRTLPPNQRVLGTIPPFPGSRILIQHMLDRACIGHCFSYGNYEAAAGLFRVRATPGNPYAMTDFDATADMEMGVYEVQAEDLPVYDVYPCKPDDTALCIRELHEGDLNDPYATAPEP